MGIKLTTLLGVTSNSTDGDTIFGSLECANIQRGAEKLASLCAVTMGVGTMPADQKCDQ